MPPPRESTARRISMSALGSRGPSMWERLALCEQVWRNVDQDCLAEYEYGNCFWIVQIEQKHWILMMLCWSWQAAVLLVYILIHRSLRWSILSLFQEGLAKWSPGFHDLSHTDCFLTGLAGPLRLRGSFTSYRNPLTQVANFAAKIENPTLNTAGDLLHGRWRVLWGPAHLPSFDHLPVHPQRVRCHQLFKCISTPSNKSPLVPILALFDPFSCNQLTCSTSYFFILPHHLSFRWSWRYSSTTSAASPMIPAPAIDGRHWDPQKVPWAAAFIGPWGFSSAVIDRKHREKDA